MNIMMGKIGNEWDNEFNMMNMSIDMMKCNILSCNNRNLCFRYWD